MSVLSSATGGFALMGSLIVAVGAQNTFVLQQGLRREHVGAIVLFCIAADVSLMTAGVAGLGAAIGRVPGLTSALTVGGAAFLGWYAWSALRRAVRPHVMAADAAGLALPLRAALGRAAGFTLLNPHVYLDTVLLMGSVSAALAADQRPGFLVGASLASTSWFLALIYGARLLAPLFRKPSAWRLLDGVVAATMMVLALTLVRQVVAGQL
ncbi:MAG: LysE/ArgO family amino acid transporter [Janthinobacterium lividum]